MCLGYLEEGDSWCKQKVKHRQKVRLAQTQLHTTVTARIKRYFKRVQTQRAPVREHAHIFMLNISRGRKRLNGADANTHTSGFLFLSRTNKHTQKRREKLRQVEPKPQ